MLFYTAPRLIGATLAVIAGHFEVTLETAPEVDDALLIGNCLDT
jgi:hypothetical protein